MSNGRANGKKPWLRGLVAGLIVICGAIITWYMLAPSDAEAEASKKQRGLIKEVKPASVQKITEETTKKPKSVKPAMTGVAVEAKKPMTPEEIEAEERKKDPLYDRHHIVAKKPLVEDPTEQLILSVFSTELGDMPPMIPAIPEVDEKRMKKMINFLTLEKPDDTDEVKDAKSIVNDVKGELKKYLDEGGTVNSFLAYYVNQLDSAYRERNLCKEMQMKSMKNDAPEDARAFYYKCNERLSAKGIKPLTLTKRQKEYLGITEN